MTRSPNRHPRPDGHVLVPAMAIGGLSIILAAGLAAIGAVERLNAMVATLLSMGGREDFPRHLPEWGVWLGTVFFGFGLPLVLLATPGLWRRVILWTSSTVLVAAWAPVLSLAAHRPDLAAPWVATVWSGVCAIIYAANHRMPCEPPARPPA